jgi:hypothetical protein
LDRAGSGSGQVAGTCECGNEPSGSINCGEYLAKMKTCKLFKKDSATWSKYVSKPFGPLLKVHFVRNNPNIWRQTDPLIIQFIIFCA